MPRVSVVMPMYNAAPYVSAAINSIQNQTFQQWELLVVDDGSTDESPAIVRSLAQQDSRIQLIANPGPKGPAAARNAGLDAARCEYVVMMDADDISLPQRLQVQLNFMEGHPAIDMAGCWARECGARTRLLWVFPFGWLLRATWLLRYPYICATIILRRAAITERYATHFARSEDAHFCNRITMRHRVANIPRVLYHYRIHETSLSQRVPSSGQKPVLHALIEEFYGFTPNEAQLDALLSLRGVSQEAGLRQQAAWVWFWLRHGRQALWQKAVAASWFCMDKLVLAIKRLPCD